VASVRDAAGAVRRGAHQEALVVLWNEVEPARLAGDRSRLARIEGLAARIAQEGDDAERREAERLLEVVRAAAQDSGAQAATGPIEGELSPVGERLERTIGEEAAGEEASSRAGLGPFVWFLILLGIVVLNLLGQLRE
jgi:hypothetical protein